MWELNKGNKNILSEPDIKGKLFTSGCCKNHARAKNAYRPEGAIKKDTNGRSPSRYESGGNPMKLDLGMIRQL